MSDLETRIAAEVAALEGLDLEGLRSAWRRHLGCPPKVRSADLLRHHLAWRIQAAAFGGLDADAKRSLRQANPRRKRFLHQPGDRLIREWDGVRHEVTVTEAGLVYGGEAFKSLSAVARAITGVRWNGPRFFGLREEAD